jgi:hypothetical protein
MSDPDKKAKLYSSNKNWTKKNKGRYSDYLFPSTFKKFGVDFTKVEYLKLLESQLGKCAICRGVELRKGKKIRLSVDHCHTTGKVRGLLCGNCNRAIGLLKDDSSLLLKAVLYLQNIS